MNEIIKIDDDAIIKKVKDGTLEYEETVKVMKNTGGTLKSLYNKVAKETFNQKNYGKFYNNFQKLKKTGNMDKIWSYNDVIDKNIDTVLSDLPEGYRTEVKIMLKNDLKLALESKTKTNPIVPNKTPKKPKVTKKAKVTTPTSEFSPDSAIKNLLNDTGEITEQKILDATQKDLDALAVKYNIPKESVALFNEMILSKIKSAIPENVEKSFDNMLKVYKTLNPVERKSFFEKISTEMNESLQSGITKIEKSAGFKFGPNFLTNFITKNKIGELMFGVHKYEGIGKPGSILKVIVHMWSSAFVISVIDSLFELATLTKGGEKKGTGLFNTIKILTTGTNEEKSELVGTIAWNHLVPFINVVTQSFNTVIHIGEAVWSHFSKWRKDMSDNSNNKKDTETDTKQSTIEKGKDKLLEIFKSSLSKVEPKILDVYLNNITLNEKGDGLILTDNGTVYEIHKPLLGKNAFIVDGEDKYMFTNEMFTK